MCQPRRRPVGTGADHSITAGHSYSDAAYRAIHLYQSQAQLFPDFFKAVDIADLLDRYDISPSSSTGLHRHSGERENSLRCNIHASPARPLIGPCMKHGEKEDHCCAVTLLYDIRHTYLLIYKRLLLPSLLPLLSLLPFSPSPLIFTSQHLTFTL